VSGIIGTPSVGKHLPGTQWPKFYTYLSGVMSNANQTMTFDSKVYDIGNNFNTSTHKFTAPMSGYYNLTLNVSFNGINDSTAYFGCNFVVNDVGGDWQWIWENSKAHDYWSACISRQFYIGTGQTAYCKKSGSGTGQFSSIRSGQNDTTFSGYLIS